MVKVYGVSLALGVVGLLAVILGGTLAENLNRPEADPGRRMGARGRTAIGALVGFGMAGLSAEFSVWDLTWQLALLVAVVGSLAGGFWAWYASSRDSGSDAGPV